jgi:hypothetical protein
VGETAHVAGDDLFPATPGPPEGFYSPVENIDYQSIASATSPS